MQATLAIPGLVLAVVFAAAGVGKLADREGTRTAVRAFGSPERIAGPLGRVLPVAELLVALLLLVGPARLGGAAALGLLVAFSGAVALSLARGRTPDCHCFGQLHSAPASWKTLARNAVLALLAAVVLARGTSGVRGFAWVGTLSPAQTLALGATLGAAALIASGGLLILALMRAYGRVLVRLDALEAGTPASAGLPELGLDPGTPAPALSAQRVDGAEVSLDALLEPGLPLLLVFTSPTCGPCRGLLPSLSRWQEEHRERLTLATLSSGDRAAIRTEAEEHGLAWALVDEDLAVYEAYQATGTPSAVLVSPDGRIASYVAAGAEAIEELVERALVPGEDDAAGLPLGVAAPALDLRDLDGEPIPLADPDGRETLVLFWNPGCGFCNSMRSDLHAWEREAFDGPLRLLVVSSGDVEESRADGFRSSVALDPEYSAGSVFGARGTPMAVLLDGEGRVASKLVAGGTAVMSLAAAHTRPGARVAATS
jgi:thiol-disulfide isomerase/thioredoxin/uncharacterized membrane protein YphA (DoxX/SURF4 family)